MVADNTLPPLLHTHGTKNLGRKISELWTLTLATDGVNGGSEGVYVNTSLE